MRRAGMLAAGAAAAAAHLDGVHDDLALGEHGGVRAVEPDARDAAQVVAAVDQPAVVAAADAVEPHLRSKWRTGCFGRRWFQGQCCLPGSWPKWRSLQQARPPNARRLASTRTWLLAAHAPGCSCRRRRGRAPARRTPARSRGPAWWRRRACSCPRCSSPAGSSGASPAQRAQHAAHAEQRGEALLRAMAPFLRARRQHLPSLPQNSPW